MLFISDKVNQTEPALNLCKWRNAFIIKQEPYLGHASIYVHERKCHWPLILTMQNYSHYRPRLLDTPDLGHELHDEGKYCCY